MFLIYCFSFFFFPWLHITQYLASPAVLHERCHTWYQSFELRAPSPVGKVMLSIQRSLFLIITFRKNIFNYAYKIGNRHSHVLDFSKIIVILIFVQHRSLKMPWKNYKQSYINYRNIQESMLGRDEEYKM